MPAIVRHSAAPASIAARPFSSLSDEELLVDLKKGSDAHFSELYERYFNRIYTFSYARVRNHADAEEIAQETFMAVFRSVEAYRGQASLLSWIYGIAKNTANNHLRRARLQDLRADSVEPEALAPMPSLGICGPEEQLELNRYTEAVRQRLEGVADWQLEIFRMRHLEDLSISEICARTDRSSDAVRSSLYRVKRLFLDAADAAQAS